MHRSTLLLTIRCSARTGLARRRPRLTIHALLTAEKMWALKRLGDPAITPDGLTAVVPVTTYDIEENKGLTDLWLIPGRRRRRAPAHQPTRPATRSRR